VSVFVAVTLSIRNAAFVGNANRIALAGLPQAAMKRLELLFRDIRVAGSKHDGATFCEDPLSEFAATMHDVLCCSTL
jgi:hypothetical protein